MSRILSLSLAILLSLLPAVAFSAPTQKQHLHHWHGYGFLPGYHQPPNPHIPVYGPNRSEPDYTPMYWYMGDWHYYGRPGFYRGRYNGGSFGPCWTWTPIGPAWQCGRSQ
jgi:hypothetical protein